MKPIKDGTEHAVEHPDANAEDCDHHCRNYIGKETNNTTALGDIDDN